ncbi:MAG: hypothetical protein AAGK79_13335 [Pseudomonadota bacterium]
MSDRQERFLQAKATLDRSIRRISALAADAYEEAIACCGADDLDNRERFTRISAHLDGALKEMKLARAMAGEVNGGPQDQPITRGGGT